MGNFNLNTENNSYPIILIPEKILKFQKSKIENRDIANYLNLKYPILDLKIYDINEVHKYKKIINEIDFLNPDKENNSLFSKYYIGGYELPKKPKRFEAEIKDDNGILYYVLFVLVITIFIGIFLKLFIALVFFFFMLFITILYYGIIPDQKTTYIPVDESVFNSKYEKFLIEYNVIKDKVKFQFFSVKNEIDEKISAKRNEIEKLIFLENLKPFCSITKLLNPNVRGKSELFFLSKLFENFNSQIHMDVVPNVGKNPYQPDFVLICYETGFHINIEIDEPYSVNNGKPIHHDRSNDFKRDKFFLESNWGVIRFTEKQIIQNTNECIFLIKNLLFAIKNKKDNLNHDVIPQSKWTYEEALIMSNNNYRNTYLPINMKINIKYDESDNMFKNYDLPF